SPACRRARWALCSSPRYDGLSQRVNEEAMRMPVRKAEARWEGNLPDGKGTVRFGGGAFEGQYSFSSRFEEGAGTNPEELIAAAHASCFAMALSNGLAKGGNTPKRVAATARVRLEKVGEGFSITRSDLSV